LRVGNFVLVSSIRQQSATTKIQGAANGSFTVSCLDGSVGVLTVEGKSGQFLQAGQSLTISGGEVLSSLSPATTTRGHNSHSGWLYLGLGGAASAAAAAGLAHGGGKQSISPSAPQGKAAGALEIRPGGKRDSQCPLLWPLPVRE